MERHSEPREHPFTDRVLDAEVLEPRGGSGWPRKHSAPARTYQVPHRFGLGSVLVVTAFLCVLFGLMRFCMPPVVMAYVGLQILAAGAMQMLLRKQPRAGSALAGVILLPAYVIGCAIFFGGGQLADPAESVMSVVCLAIPGGILGYIAGLLIAAVFMFMQMADEMISRAKTRSRETLPPRDPDGGP